jgi:hypothetical protein
MRENHHLFIEESYLLKKEILQRHRMYGLGIVIRKDDLSRAILEKRISANIISDRNLRVVTE